jgi:hypothetical protein
METKTNPKHTGSSLCHYSWFIFLGHFTNILSTKLRTSKGFGFCTTVNGIFLYFVRKLSFYQTQVAEAFIVSFYLSPLTYIVGISRAGFFSQFTGLVNIDVILLTLFCLPLATAIRSFMGRSNTRLSTQVWQQRILDESKLDSPFCHPE